MKKTKPDIIGWSPGTPTDPGLLPARPTQPDSSKYFLPRIRNAFGPVNYSPGIFSAQATKRKQELLLAWPIS